MPTRRCPRKKPYRRRSPTTGRTRCVKRCRSPTPVSYRSSTGKKWCRRSPSPTRRRRKRTPLTRRKRRVSPKLKLWRDSVWEAVEQTGVNYAKILKHKTLVNPSERAAATRAYNLAKSIYEEKSSGIFYSPPTELGELGELDYYY